MDRQQLVRRMIDVEAMLPADRLGIPVGARLQGNLPELRATGEERFAGRDPLPTGGADL